MTLGITFSKCCMYLLHFLTSTVCQMLLCHPPFHFGLLAWLHVAYTPKNITSVTRSSMHVCHITLSSCHRFFYGFEVRTLRRRPPPVDPTLLEHPPPVDSTLFERPPPVDPILFCTIFEVCFVLLSCINLC